MALLAEELVEEWLRRQGYFTIRGIRLGVQEIDLLAVRLLPSGVHARHVEVQASVNPMNYLTPLTAAIQKSRGVRGPNVAITRTAEEIAACVDQWVAKKFDHPRKKALRDRLLPDLEWAREVVIHRAKHEEEIRQLSQRVAVHRLSDVMLALRNDGDPVPRAGGTDFVDLAHLTISIDLEADSAS